MKTDNEDTLRVTLTFRRESSPEWYALLLKTTSGRARAEHVRQHLTLPRFAITTDTAPPAQAEPVKSSVTATVISASASENNSRPTVSVETPLVNSLSDSSDKSATYDDKKPVSDTTVNYAPPAETGTINSNVTATKEAPRTRGGMAQIVISVKNNEDVKS